MFRWPCLLAAMAVWTALVAPATAPAQAPAARNPDSRPKMAVYDTPFYIIHTDLDLPDAREAAIRMTHMAEEYHARTAEFSGAVNHKLPFFLYRNPQDYFAAGGLKNSAGCFTGSQLMAIAGDHPTSATWHVVQHEGFHQFADAAIGGNLPTWLNEGLAEYFGEAVFTGDSFISGVIPSMRLRRIKAELDAGPDGFKSIPELMTLTRDQWNGQMSMLNYDQAWSLVHFLAHGEDGKYQKPFANFIRQIGRGADWQIAWRNNFGNAVGLEQHWRDYWKNLPPRPSDVLYAKANIATLTGFIGRCAEQKQTFGTFDDFLSAIADKSLKISDGDWLPPDLIETAAAIALRRQEEGAKYALLSKPPKAECVLPDGTRLTGSYSIKDGCLSQVTVDIVEPKKEPATKK